MGLYDFFFFSPMAYAFFWIVDLSLLGLLVEEHDSLQQLIQGRADLCWYEFYVKLTRSVLNRKIGRSLNFLVTLCLKQAKVRSLCKLCTSSISPSNNPMWYKVCGFFLYFRPLYFRFGPFVFFRFSIRLLIWFRIRLQKLWRLGIDKVSIASRQISLRTVRGTLVCFIRGVKVLWTHVTLLGLARTSNS